MAAVAMPRGAKGRPARGRAPKAAEKPMSVLLVDDHPLWRDTLRQVLERKRFATVVAEASDGLEAVQRAREMRPDVVVMDIQLPDKNGIEATRELVAEWPEAKVLVLASSDSRSQVLEAVAAGASGYLLKTASSDDVRESVRRVREGELVFPPSLASVVLDELRQRPGRGEHHDANRFRREGDFWTVSFGGDVFRLKHIRGATHLATLLRNPGREFHCIDLAGGERMTGALAGQDAGPLLDPAAKKAYRRKLEELEEEVEEADGWGDGERASRARGEIEGIREQLSAAVGLGGRDRRAAATSERARVSVTLAIKAALSKIADYSPGLSEHLASTIKTGTYCSYTPDPRAPISW